MIVAFFRDAIYCCVASIAAAVAVPSLSVSPSRIRLFFFLLFFFLLRFAVFVGPSHIYVCNVYPISVVWREAAKGGGGDDDDEIKHLRE